MPAKSAKLAAVMAGVLLLGVPSAIFNDRLVASVERQAAAEMALAARRTVAVDATTFGRSSRPSICHAHSSSTAVS